MINFGAGVGFATPQYDIAGAAIANPSPIQFLTLQDISVDESFEMKKLYGAKKFPRAVAQGKGSVSIKAAIAEFSGALYNNLFYGLTPTAAYSAIKEDLTGTAIPATPFQITPTPPSSGTWVADLGVRGSANGPPLTRVASSPATGQYSVAAGVYTFAAADTTKVVFINFAYSAATPAGGQKLIKLNQPMGVQPVFTLDLQGTGEGKTRYTRYLSVIGMKLSTSRKNDDFSIPNFEMEAFEDMAGTGVVSYDWYYE